MNGALVCQKLLYDALTNNVALINALGGAFIYDDVPSQKALPYITFGKITSNEWNTSSELGLENFAELIIWEKGKGRKKCLNLIQLIIDALDDIASTTGDQSLVNIHTQKTLTQYDKANKCFTAVLTLRMVTEPTTHS